MANESCILCGISAQYTPIPPINSEYECECPNCGKYRVTDHFSLYEISKYNPIEKARISGYIRELNELGNKTIALSNDIASDILNNSIIARTLNQRLNKFLLYMLNKTNSLGEDIIFNARKNFAVVYAISPSEAFAIIDYAKQKHYITASSDVSYRLTYDGFAHAETLKEAILTSDSAFVAMWFSPEMYAIYDTAIKPAIEAKECGSFKAFRVDNHEHNNDITDEIIAGIKACRFMVADLTGYRGGVYYEAGFAHGLGKPVIYTCRKDWFDGETAPEGNKVKEKVHFDLTHQNIIVWESAEYLKQRIIDRIRATII